MIVELQLAGCLIYSQQILFHFIHGHHGCIKTQTHGKGYDDLRWPRDMQRATVSDVASTCEQEGIAMPAEGSAWVHLHGLIAGAS